MLLAIDDHEVDAEGTVLITDFAEPLRVNLRYIIQRAVIGTTLRFTVLRNGERIVVPVKTSPRKPRLLPPRQPVRGVPCAPIPSLRHGTCTHSLARARTHC